ncbi:MAG: DUF2267 domain-containing protein [Chloroflexota bacterium]
MPEESAIDTTVQKTKLWLKQIMDKLHRDDEHFAFQCLRAVLHSVRDRMPVDEAAQLGAQFPLLVRGVYYEGWRPSATPQKERHLDEFLSRVRQEFRKEPDIDPLTITRAVLRVISSEIDRGEIEDVKKLMPAELHQLWTD